MPVFTEYKTNKTVSFGESADPRINEIDFFSKFVLYAPALVSKHISRGYVESNSLIKQTQRSFFIIKWMKYKMYFWMFFSKFGFTRFGNVTIFCDASSLTVSLAIFIFYDLSWSVLIIFTKVILGFPEMFYSLLM